MEISSTHQLYMFFLCVLSGIVCGIFFDIQRSLRKMYVAGKVRTMLEDLLFTLVCIAVMIALGYIFNCGQMRYYQIMGFISGAMFYVAFLSSVTTKVLIRMYRIFAAVVVNPSVKIVKIFIAPLKKTYGCFNAKYLKLKFYKKRAVQIVRKKKKYLKKRMKML